MSRRLRNRLSWVPSALLASVVLCHALTLRAVEQTAYVAGAFLSESLGDGTYSYEPSFREIAKNAAQVSIGDEHSAYVTTDGKLYVMGANRYGQLGLSDTQARPFPVQVPNVSNVIAVAVGNQHTVFIKSDHTLWGMGRSNTLGINTTTSIPQTTPIQITSGVAAVEAGYQHIMILKQDGTLYTAGLNSSGVLGTGNGSNQYTPVLIKSGIASIAASWYSAMCVTTTGELFVMGSNSSGQLGGGATPSFSSPTQVATDVAQARVGNVNGILLKTDGTVLTTGSNNNGQLGAATNGSAASVNVFSPIVYATGTITSTPTKVDAGFNHTLIIMQDGTLWAAGSAQNFPTGSATYTNKFTQRATNVAAISTQNASTAYITPQNALFVVGLTDQGQLGTGRRAQVGVPTELLRDARSIAFSLTGDPRTFIVNSAGTLFATGNNSNRLLGLTDGLPRTTLAPVDTGVASVYSAPNHTLFLYDNQKLKAIGLSNHGQLGNGGATLTSITEIASGVIDVAAGFDYTLYVSTGNILYGMGYNGYNQLAGTGTADITTPTQIATNVRRVVTSRLYATFYITTNDELWALGRNVGGLLGTGNTATQTAPVLIMTNVADVSVSSTHTLVLKKDGTLWGIGSTFLGALGTTPYSNFLTPTQLTSNVTSCAAGTNVSYYVDTNGNTYAMGANDVGQLVNLGEGTDSAIPTACAINSVAKVFAAETGRVGFLANSPTVQINSQPANITTTAGTSFTLTVAAIGSGTLHYQWYRGSRGDILNPIIGANASSYTSTALDDGAYWVAVSDNASSTVSASAYLDVTLAINFAEWLTAQSLPADQLNSNAVSDADPDADGLGNFLEYFLSSSSLQSRRDHAPTLSLLRSGGSSYLTLTHRQRRASLITPSYEASDDMITWSPVTPGLSVLTANPDGDGLTDVINATLLIKPADPRRFLRLRIDQP